MHKFLLVCGSLMLYVLLFTGCADTNIGNKVQEAKQQDIEISTNKDTSAAESIPIEDSSKTIISPKPPEKKLLSADEPNFPPADRYNLFLDDFVKFGWGDFSDINNYNTTTYPTIEDAIEDTLEYPYPSPFYLRETLVGLGYSDDEIIKAYDNISIDWLSYAQIFATAALSEGPSPSKLELIDSMVGFKYSNDIATAAFSGISVDWVGNALGELEEAVGTDFISDSDKSMREYLKKRKFTDAEIKQAIKLYKTQ